MKDLSKKKRGFRYLLAAAAAEGEAIKSPKPSYVDRRLTTPGVGRCPFRTIVPCRVTGNGTKK